jgi:hypothetical protein
MFKLSDYIDKLTIVCEKNTEITFICPICGSNKLKFNKSNFAYKCYENFCSSKSIREKLGFRNTYDEQTKGSSIIIEESVTWKYNNNTYNFITVDNYKKAKIQNIGKKTITNYKYNDNCIVQRVDYENEQKRKDIFPKYKNNEVWTYGSNNKFGLFNSCFIAKQGLVIMVEGEKCADELTAFSSYLTLTPPAFGWNVNYLTCSFIDFLPFITGILYLPDNDKIGLEKANIIQKASWANSIPCKIINLSKYFTMELGEDIYDLLLRESNIIKFLNESIK